MILEIQAEILGNFTLAQDMNVKKHPYTLNIFQSSENDKFYISVSKRIIDFKDNLPVLEVNENKLLELKLPPNDFYSDIICLLQHIESFGAFDVGISKIFWEEPTIIWIPENESEHLSPLCKYKGEYKHKSLVRNLTNSWLQNTVLYAKQMKDLYIPFSFFREGSNNYHQMRYQSAFLFFYMMLEYFFSNDKWGIKNDEYKRDLCLRNSLKKTLEVMPNYQEHFSFLKDELKTRNKNYDEEGLLFILNRFRDEFSHANKADKNRNVFNENKYISLAFIIMGVCQNVSIKKRLLPFVSEVDKKSFLMG